MAISSTAPAPDRDGTAAGPGTGWTRAAATALCVLLAVILALAVLGDGGYFPDDYLGLGALAALGVAGGIAAGLPERRRPTRLSLLALGSLLTLAAWGGISAAWSPDPATAHLDFGRDLTYALVLALSILAVTSHRRRALVVRLVVGVLVGGCLLALVSRMRPEIVETDAGLLAISQGRLSYPVGYWNALGAIAAMAVLGAVGLGADRRSPALARGLAAAGGVVAGCVLYLTLSRASGIALAIGLAVILALSPRRIGLAASAALVLGGATLAILVVRTEAILVDAPSTVAAQHDVGGPILVLVLAIALATGVAQMLLVRLGVKRPSRYSARPGVPTAVKLAPAALVAVLLVGVYAGFSDRIEGQAADGTFAIGDFLDRQYSEFLSPSGALPTGEERLTSTRSTRGEAYEVAFDALGDDPLKGDGAGGYRIRWMRDRDVSEAFRNTHSLPLEMLSERGLVGGLFLAGLFAALVAGVVRVRTLRKGLSNTVTAGAAGIVTVWLVHSAVDWDWQVAAVTLPALACGAVLLAPGGRRSATRGASIVHH